MHLVLPVLTVQIFLSVARASSPYVDVEVSDRNSAFGCSPTVAKVIFQEVVGRSSDGTQIVFERNWVSDDRAAIVLERLPYLFNVTSLRMCADVIIEAGYHAFEFANGSCTAISLLNELCCEDTSGSHIYISERFYGSSLSTEASLRMGAETEIMRPLQPLVFDLSDFTPLLELLDMIIPYPVPKSVDAVFKSDEGDLYDIPLQFLDTESCASQDPCSLIPTVSYNRNSLQNIGIGNMYYLYDYCGGSIPTPIDVGDVFFSHRGFGCEYFPSELVGTECLVHFNMTSNCEKCGTLIFVPGTPVTRSYCDDVLEAIFTYDTGALDLCAGNLQRFDTTSNEASLAVNIRKPRSLGFVSAPMFIPMPY